MPGMEPLLSILPVIMLIPGSQQASPIKPNRGFFKLTKGKCPNHNEQLNDTFIKLWNSLCFVPPQEGVKQKQEPNKKQPKPVRWGVRAGIRVDIWCPTAFPVSIPTASMPGRFLKKDIIECFFVEFCFQAQKPNVWRCIRHWKQEHRLRSHENCFLRSYSRFPV